MRRSNFEEFVKNVESLRDTGTDDFTRAHDNCFADTLSESTELQTVFRDFLDVADIEPRNVALRVGKSVQALEMADDPDFPRGRATIAAWRPTFQRITDDSVYQERFLTNIHLPIASNISERSKLLKAVLLLNGREKGAQIGDIGSSLNHGLNQLALHHIPELAYGPTEVVLARDPFLARKHRVVDQISTMSLNKLISHTGFEIGSSTGFDIFDPYRDSRVRDYARANSFSLGELLVPELIRQFDMLSTARPKQVGFKSIDMTQPLEPGMEDSVDVAYMCTMLYQLKPRERDAVLSNAERLVKDDGLVVVQDFVDYFPGRDPLYYGKRSWPWNYNVWVKDMQKPAEGFKKYFSVESGRSKRVVLQPALGHLSIAREIGLRIPAAA